ncbi:MAG: sigma-B regulation protein RsbU (phosphoserine phosphatase) [Candidatus Azotimanducaceae bacterium]|jgi:sigma-B regulation protein RsbU (phosphoserine phosphatase)
MQVASNRLLAFTSVENTPVEKAALASLETRGYTVETIADADDYLPAILSQLPDLILLPLTQPESEQILSALVGLDAHPPVLVYGDDDQSAQAGKMMQAGADEYFLCSDSENSLLQFLIERTIASHRDLDCLKAENVQLQQDLEHVEKDCKAGFAVQQRLLPEPQSFGDISFGYQLVPRAGMTGDSVNCFYLNDGRLLFYLADVAGHGVLGGVVTTALTVTAKSLAGPEFPATGQTSSDLLVWFNRAMLALELDQHVTMFLGVIDVAASTLEYSSAAHFPGTILCQQEVCQYLELGGLPLGVCETKYESAKLDLSQEFDLVLFSDGVLEILPQDTLENRENHLITLVESGSRSISALSADLNLTGRSEVPDDIAVLTLMRKAPLP